MTYTIMHEIKMGIHWYSANDDRGRYVQGSSFHSAEEVAEFLHGENKPLEVYATIEVEQ